MTNVQKWFSILLLLAVGLNSPFKDVYGQATTTAPFYLSNDIIANKNVTCHEPLYMETNYMSFMNIDPGYDYVVLYCDAFASSFYYNGTAPQVFATAELQPRLVLGGKGTSLRQIKRHPRPTLPPALVGAVVPDQFDARVKWPKCTSIGSIKDQGECDACWTSGVTSTLDDRLCIFSENNDFQVELSAYALLTCCTTCGGCPGMDQSRCVTGGSAELAYDYFITEGIVTGGAYNSLEGCVPYDYAPLPQSASVPKHPPVNSANCPFTTEFCPNKNYPVVFNNDKLKGKAYYVLNKFDQFGNIDIAATVRATQLEIMTNGSVTMTVAIYDDFRSYTGGVYTTNSGIFSGFHVMRCIGWGVDSATQLPYWLIANSWGSNWGENGFIRIWRGQNTADVESRISAAVPAQYKRVATPAGPGQSTAVETDSSKAKPYAGISDAWRSKLRYYENSCSDFYAWTHIWVYNGGDQGAQTGDRQ